MMKIRNPKFNARGSIDCEVDDPKHGWIPFTADPNDTELAGTLVYDAAIAMEPEPYTPPPPPAPEDIAAEQDREVAAMMGGSIYAAALTAALIEIHMQYGKMTQPQAEAVVRDHFLNAAKA